MIRISILIFLLFAPVFVFAQNLEIISYPIEELGGCENKEACRAFCDKFENLEKCLNFSEKNVLLTDCRLTDARKFLNAINGGLKLLPCKSKEECRVYCSDEVNFKECLNFVENAGFLSRDEALLLKRTGGKGPGACQTKEDCQEYCSQENHLDECLEFALKNGFILPAQAALAIEIRDLAAKGGPGGCVGLKACGEYCSNINNLDNCLSFEEENGLITEEEIREIEELAENGGPGECKTREDCKAYCNNPDNDQECLNFMSDQGYLSKENIEAMENQLKQTEELIRQKFEQFRQYYGEDYNSEVQKEIEEALKPYIDLIEGYKKNLK